MAKTGTWIALMLLLVLIAATAKAFLFQAEKMQYCPPQCNSCKDTRCNRRGWCSGFAVNCLAGNLDAVPPGIPVNVTALRLSENHLQAIHLGDFSKFLGLSVLLIDHNNASALTVETPNRRLRFLSLRGNHFASLPRKGLLKLKGVSELILAENHIESVRGVRFPSRIEILNLNGNRISELARNSFRKVKLLRVLKLNNNQIRRILPGAFKQLVSLEVLDMAGNSLTRLPPEAFSSLRQGFYLNLKNNQINEIHPSAFRTFGSRNPSGHQISLDHNNMQFINMDVFKVLVDRNAEPNTGPFFLTLGGNPLFCDCNFLNFRNDSGSLIADNHQLVCNLPPDVAGTRADELYIADCCY